MTIRDIYQQALRAVRSSKVAEDFEEHFTSTYGGRPRVLKVEQLLAAMVTATSTYYRSATHVTIHKVLSRDLHRDRHHLCFGWSSRRNGHGYQSKNLTLRQVRHLFNRMVAVINASPHLNPTLTEKERIATEKQGYEYLNRLVHASIPQALPSAQYQAIDATSYPTMSAPPPKPESMTTKKSKKGKRKTSSKKEFPPYEKDYQRDGSAFVRQRTGAHDPDGRWGYQTPTNGNGMQDTFFGHSALASVASYTKASPYRELKLVTAMMVIPNATDHSAATLRMINDHLIPFHGTDFTLLTDRGFTNAKPENWADHLLAAGIEQVIDMRKDDLQIRRDKDTGVIMFAGAPFLPWTPEALFEAVSRPVRYTTNPDNPEEHIEAFHAAIEALDPYALIPNETRRPNGNRQYLVPQHDRALATAAQRKTKVFTQATIRIKKQAFGKLQQHHRWGTPKWIEAYNHRTAVEGVFGNLKDREQGGVTRGWIRVVGIPAMALMLAAAMVYHNLKTAQHWAEKNLKTDVDIYEFDTETELRSQIKNDQPRQPNAPPAAA